MDEATGLASIIMKSAGTEKDEPHKPISKLLDFWWDKLILTMIVLLLGITSVQTVASYFKSGGIDCLITEDHTRTVLAYINQLCREELPNFAKYFQIALYAEVTLLSGLQVFGHCYVMVD